MKTKILKSVLALKEKKLTELSKDIGISYSALYKKLRGLSTFNAIEIKKISEVLGLSNEEIFDIFFT